jgi:hypothetical protein
MTNARYALSAGLSIVFGGYATSNQQRARDAARSSVSTIGSDTNIVDAGRWSMMRARLDVAFI